jgi:SAM-dependent methyltransferase
LADARRADLSGLGPFLDILSGTMPPTETGAGPGAQYDRFADIYRTWTDTAASTSANLVFYRDTYVAAEGPVVELGVGDGRIAVEAALRGCRLVGVDASRAMLALCRERAETAGVADRLRLLEADFRGFQLDEPGRLVALPYHSLGHLTTLEEKRRALVHIRGQLRPGGRFVFDDFLMTDELMTHMRQVQLRAAYRSAEGAERLLWVTSLVDEASQRITVVTWEDALDADGHLDQRQYRRLELSWLTSDQAGELLRETGFEVEACWGDFARTPFDEATSSEQVWMARRPE